MTSLPNRFYHWIRHPSAQSLADEQQMVRGFEHLRGHKYCLLVTYKRSGDPVPTPVWFGLGDGKLYVRSEASVAKVRRIRNDPRVRVALAPCAASRSGAPADGRARVLDDARDEEEAEAALRANYGLGRRIYERVGGGLGAETVYLEITPGYRSRVCQIAQSGSGAPMTMAARPGVRLVSPCMSPFPYQAVSTAHWRAATADIARASLPASSRGRRRSA